MRKNGALVTAAAVLCCAGLTVAHSSADPGPVARGDASTMPDGRITVRVGHLLGKVNPLVFGHNVEAADPKLIFGPRSNPIMGRTGDGVWDFRTGQPVPETVEMARQIGMKMLRYPGGCLVHNFNWKHTVGPLDERPDFTFGVDEFIAYCRAVGAEPLMTVSAYVGQPQDSADLVEYLNAPAVPEHPWAQRRAEWGHPEPYGVVYFEMGNESDHGNHDVKPFRKHTAASYSDWFNACARLMKRKDPAIRMGALTGTGTGPQDAWNRKVLERVRDQVDFIVIHTYAVGLWGEPPQQMTTDRLMRACMAAGEQMEDVLARYRGLIRRSTGRDIPLAITEYNAAFVQERPLRYRFCYGPALFSADYVRALLNPDANVLMANYWHFINGYWGMVRGPRLPDDQPRRWERMPAFYLYRLWGQHFGEQLVGVEVEAPRLEFEGAQRVRPAIGQTGLPFGVDPETDLLEGIQLSSGRARDHRWRTIGGVHVLELDAVRAEAYPSLVTLKPIRAGTYVLSYEGRSDGSLREARIGLGLTDARGWQATRSGNAVEGVQDAAEWTEFSGELTTLPDCPGLILLWRVRPGDTPASGRIEVRNIKVTPAQGFPAYAAMTSCASLSADGRTLYLVVFNKHHDAQIRAEVNVVGFPVAAARAWTVTGPSLEAQNLKEEQVGEVESGVEVQNVSSTGFRRTFPARSMTALELYRRD